MAGKRAKETSILTSSAGYQSLWNNPERSDVTIKFAEQEIRAHKLLLIYNSEYFARMFDNNNGFSDSLKDTITLEDDDPTALTVIFRWMYGFAIEIPATLDNPLLYIISLLTVADKYALSSGLLPKLTRMLHVELNDARPHQLPDVVLYIYDHDVPGFIRKYVQGHPYGEIEWLVESERWCARFESDADIADEVFDVCSQVWELGHDHTIKNAFRNLMDCREAEWVFKLLLARLRHCVHINARKFGWFHRQLNTDTGRLPYKNNKRLCMDVLFEFLGETSDGDGY